MLDFDIYPCYYIARMDFVIKLINKENKVTGIGADHFGYEDLMFKSVDILLALLKGKSVAVENFKFLKEHFKTVNLRLEEAPDIIIDDKHHKVTNCLGFVIQKLNEVEVKQKLNNVDFERIDLMLNETMSYEDFDILYDFISKNSNNGPITINNEYLFTPQVSLEKY